MSKNEAPKMLEHEELAQVVRLAPLVSIDLIIEDSHGRILLGMRTNEPARGYWFVPGGRILKNERITQAFERVVKNELGLEMDYAQGEFVGVFEHIYSTNFALEKDFGTHYVVLAHRIKLIDSVDVSSDNQHSELVWFDKDRILEDAKVHPNTKAYFEGS